MKTLPPLVIEQASNGCGTHVAFRITHQDEKLIPRGTFYERGGDFIFKSVGAPDYEPRGSMFCPHICLRGTLYDADDYVIIVPSEKSKRFQQAVADLNKMLAPILASSSSVTRQVRSYLKKNIVGGKIVDL